MPVPHRFEYHRIFITYSCSYELPQRTQSSIKNRPQTQLQPQPYQSGSILQNRNTSVEKQYRVLLLTFFEARGSDISSKNNSTLSLNVCNEKLKTVRTSNTRGEPTKISVAELHTIISISFLLYVCDECMGPTALSHDAIVWIARQAG